SMFKREKLSGLNFNDWFRSLKLVLRVEKKLYIIKQPIPLAHAASSADQVFDEWNAIYDAHNEELKSMFEKQARVERKTIGELHALLIEYGKDLPKKAATPQVLAVQGARIFKSNKKSQNAKEKGKGKGKGKDTLVYAPKPKNSKTYAKEHPTKDDACHHCKEVEHWKRIVLCILLS
nr:hypothetical protein [Tanacetum cinerariifolium]